ncbi:MAG: DUF1501 domain-containing protein [Planctomycetes bacterium]|nr:DUF1501 domain-containing protein [Planctomycetota bacterium]
MGFTGLALGALLHRDGWGRDHNTGEIPDGRPHFAPRAKSVIWFCMLGGTSHLESFDPKPEIDKYAGKTFTETPHNDAIVKSPYYRSNVRDFAGVPRDLMPTLYPTQIGFKPRGDSGIPVSDWWPHVGGCIDDVAVVRSMWTTDNDHAAQLQFHTGRHIFDGFHPSIGSWVHYGLGSLNDNLPQFIVMGGSPGDCCGGVGAHGASYLGPEHAAVPLNIDPANPLAFGKPAIAVSEQQRLEELELLRELNGVAQAEYPRDQALAARVKAYELAFRMQMAVPGILNINEETASTRTAYGLDKDPTRRMGQLCLAARRLVEQGVRFIQIYDDGWDAHSKLKENHSTRCAAVDQPIAALLADLKQRGLLEETVVVWGTEFGRTPGAERSDGRDHHPYGFSIWMAGGGVRGGTIHGATDELGFHAVQDRHYVTDLHATVLHQLGLDSRRLEVPGQKRLEIDFGQPIRAILV